MVYSFTMKSRYEEPIYIGTINNTPVRFYRPQTDDDMMPWVASDDLMSALALPRNVRRLMHLANSKHSSLVKCIETGSGALDVLAFQAVQGLVGAIRKLELVPDIDWVHMAYVEAAVTATKHTSPALFDPDSDGRFRMRSDILAMLLGTTSQAIADQMEREGISAQEAPPRRIH
jgi:hypothetical protein